MEKYELLFIIPAKFTETELGEQAGKIKEIVTAAGASVTETHDLGRRKLAYPIKNVRTGNYFLSYFDAEQGAVAKLNEMLRLSSDVLRHLIVVRDEKIVKVPSFAEEEMRRERQETPTRAPQPVPQQAPLAPKEKITMEELDKKLDEILTDDIL